MKDLWNFSDLFTCALAIIYSLKKIIQIDNEDANVLDENRYLLAALTLNAWLRGLSYLRLFKQTRSLIRLVIEVIKDMKAFAIVLFLSVVAFTLTYYSLVGNLTL
jgi:hypothetical protein